MRFIRNCLLAALLFPSLAIAQTPWKPERNVEIVVGSSPGSGTDRTARDIERLWRETGLINVSSVVVNRPGGGGAVAFAYLGQKSGDAHSLLVGSYNIVTNHITGRSSITYSDFTPITLLFSEYIAYWVRADSRFKTPQELFAQIKKDPSSIAAGVSSSVGGANHIAYSLLLKTLGVSPKQGKVVVFNSGGDTMTALLGGHIDLMVASASVVAGSLAAGQVRGLAYAAPKRLSGPFASIPTLTELGHKVAADNWRLIIAPRGLTPAQAGYWDGVFKRLVSTEEWDKLLDAKHLSNTYLNSADTRRHLDKEYSEIKDILGELGLARPPAAK
jgi:putative tricarboxylic transport membrane protein